VIGDRRTKRTGRKLLFVLQLRTPHQVETGAKETV
jgi:hypothetical protein